MNKVLLVKDIMIKKVITVKADATIQETAEILAKDGFSGAPVVNEYNELVGVISEKDLFKALYPSYKEFYLEDSLALLADPDKMQELIQDKGAVKIKEIIEDKPITVTPETPLVRAGAIMLAKHVHRLPVIEKEKLVGLISRRDLYRTIFKELFKF